MTPICPQCGSVRVRRTRGRHFGECHEPDCGHVSPWRAFRNYVAAPARANGHWRDPVALLPGGYEDNG